MKPENPQSPEKLIGRQAYEVVIELARVNPQIKTMVFARYFPYDKGETDLFWHFSREEILSGGKVDWLVSPDLVVRDSLISFTSRVEIEPEPPPPGYISIRHEWRQTPILFLNLTPSVHQTEIGEMKNFLRDLGQKSGWILNIPETPYYYFCGCELMTDEEWMAFMLRVKNEGLRKGFVREKFIDLALLPKNVRQTGIETIGMGLAHPYATMRISTNAYLPRAPEVVTVL